jgi:hypothetical protein
LTAAAHPKYLLRWIIVPYSPTLAYLKYLLWTVDIFDIWVLAETAKLPKMDFPTPKMKEKCPKT